MGEKFLKKLTFNKYAIAACISMCVMMAIYFNGSSNYCEITFTGNMLVKSRFRSFIGELKYLNQLPIQITGQIGYQKKISETKTSLTNGRFEKTLRFSDVAPDKCSLDVFKIESSFVHGTDLSITRGDWDIIKTWDLVANQQSHQCQSNVCDLGDLIFGLGSQNSLGIELGADVNFRQADIWWASMFLINYVKSLGFPFKSRLAIAFPFDEIDSNLSFRSSYANPLTRQIQLMREVFYYPIGTLLFHEIGHIWSYDYSKNGMDLFWYFLLNGGNTHEMLSSKSVAFYEGFAEVFGNYIFYELLKAEGKNTEDAGYKQNFIEWGMLLPRSLTSYTFSHERLDPSFNNYLNPAILESWSKNSECVHHKKGTFDCSDMGWESFLEALILENNPIETYNNERYQKLINFDLINHVSSLGFDYPIEDLRDDSFCRERPKLSFLELLKSLKGDGPNDLIDSPDMEIDAYFKRLMRLELGNLENNEQSVEMLKTFKLPFDIDYKNAGSFYSSFCSPAVFATLSNNDTKPYPPTAFGWSDITSMEPGFGTLKLHLYLSSTESVRDFVSLRSSVTSSQGFGKTFISLPDVENFGNGSGQTNYFMVSPYDEDENKIQAFEGAKHKYILKFNVRLMANDSLPVTRIKITPRVGCYQMMNYPFFESDNVIGDQNFWANHNCELNAENSINLFEDSNGNLDWQSGDFTVYIGADYKPTVKSFFIDPSIASTSIFPTEDNNGTEISIPLIASANALVKTGTVNKRVIKTKPATTRNLNLRSTNYREAVQEYRQNQTVESQLGPSLTANVNWIEKQLKADKFLGICEVKNIGNARPGISSEVKISTYTGKLSEIMANRSNWKEVKTDIITQLPAGNQKYVETSFELPSPKLLMMQKGIIPETKRVLLTDATYLICETDIRGDFEELSEANNISITQVRDEIYYNGGIEIKTNLPSLSVMENPNLIIQESQMINALQNAIIQGEMNQAFQLFNSEIFQYPYVKGTANYQRYIQREYPIKAKTK